MRKSPRSHLAFNLIKGSPLRALLCVVGATALFLQKPIEDGTISRKTSLVDEQIDSEESIRWSVDGTPEILYSRGRKDRSGAVIHDMLMAHAYAFSRGVPYGGACYSREDLKFRPLPEAVQILASLNLTTTLPFVPCDDKVIANDTIYRSDRRFTDAWRRTVPYANRKNQVLQIAVHVRRGDVIPCNWVAPRYLPNSYYMEQIKASIPEDGRPYNISIFTESENFESTDVFESLENVHLNIDGPLEDVWHALSSSDVAILSRSSFSMVPALLNPNKVIYSPFWHKPQPGWTVMKELSEAVQEDLEVLKQKCPQSTVLPVEN